MRFELQYLVQPFPQVVYCNQASHQLAGLQCRCGRGILQELQSLALSCMRGWLRDAGLQERIVHEQLAAGKGGWRGRHGYYMPAPADRLVRPCSPYVPLAHSITSSLGLLWLSFGCQTRYKYRQLHKDAVLKETPNRYQVLRCSLNVLRLWKVAAGLHF